MSENRRIPSAAVFGCAGPVLTDAEASFFTEINPFGFILFTRNIDTPEQVQRLIADLRASVGRADAPVLVDQEGGRVQRLKPPQWRQTPSAQTFGTLFARDRAVARRAARLNTLLTAADLSTLGFSVVCAPVLDVLTPDTHIAIGDRAFSGDPECVADLGHIVVEAFLEQGVLPTIKHMPGHGRAKIDSHLGLPVITETLDVLDRVDFAPFRSLRDAPLGMLAHLAFDVMTKGQPLTLSGAGIRDLIRTRIGFDGFLFTDDVSMKALGGDFAWRARTALEAGCDAIMHCNGNPEEMRAVREGLLPLSEEAWQKWHLAQKRVEHPVIPIDYDSAFFELSDILVRWNVWTDGR